MSPVALSALLLAAAATGVHAQGVIAPTETFPAVPLIDKHFTYPDGLPYQADTDHLIRGVQLGYNICNSTTQNQESLCQTAMLNHIDDFCLWGPPEPDMDVGSHEGEMVAWCTKKYHGARLIPEGTLQGLQYITTPDYVALTGFIDQTRVNILEGDFGGELDPHGADLRGNPLGGLVFSNAFSGSNSSYTQVMEWHMFIGGNAFCFKICDPAGAFDERYCEHIFDRIGCAYNVPSNARNGTFEACDGDNQDFPGIYTSNGAVMTYTQPAESLGPITTMPYQPRVPASSNCVVFQSEELFTEIATVYAPGHSPTPTPSSSSGGSNGGSTTTRSGGSNPSETGTSGNSNGASSLAISMLSLMGVAFSVAMFS